MKQKISIAYFGTGDFSKNILQDIHDNFSDDIEIKLVVSQVDKAIWRKKILTPTPVKAYANQHHLDIVQPTVLWGTSPLWDILMRLHVDVIVVVAYGKIIPPSILKIPPHGCVNIHGSILPRYRWASPIQECLKNWDTQTWLTIMYMSEGMDEWDILKIQTIEIDKVDKTPDIFKKFEWFGAKLLVETLKWIHSWTLPHIPQNPCSSNLLY